MTSGKRVPLSKKRRFDIFDRDIARKIRSGAESLQESVA